MKDIDFDELDRAVSSVLGQKVTEDTAASAGVIKNEQADSDDTVVTVENQPMAVDTAQAVPPANEPPQVTTQPVASLAVKRRGKFMDVMHPSADMQPVNTPTVKAPRPAPVIAPLPTQVVDSPDDLPSEPTAALDESHSLIGAEPAPVDTNFTDSVSSNVDAETPVDTFVDAPQAETADVVAPQTEMSVDEASSESSQPMPVDNESVPDDDSDRPVTQADAQTDIPAPQTTPFLSDTQVEKRPLGAFGDADAPGAEAAPPATMSESSVATKDTAPAALPRELQPDVVGVESVQATETLEAPSGGSVSPFAAKVGVAPEANDGRVEGHPLFDTSTYHEPIAAVHHAGMPGWLKWLIGLLACLAIGAGVGYFLFTAGL